MTPTDPTPYTPTDALVDDIIRWDATVAKDGPCDGTWDSLADYLIGRGWTHTEEPSEAQTLTEQIARRLYTWDVEDGPFRDKPWEDLTESQRNIWRSGAAAVLPVVKSARRDARAEAIKEHKRSQPAVHIEPAPPREIPVRLPCPRCGAR